VEYGRQYIELTRKYAGYFKKGITPPPLAPSKYTDARQVSIDLGAENKEDGLKLVRLGDGLNEPAERGNRWGRRTAANADSAARYLYFDVYEDFIYSQPSQVEIAIDYFDEGTAPIALQYDSTEDKDGHSMAAIYKHMPVAKLQNTLTWRTASVLLPDARFGNRENLGTDFRLHIEGADLTVARVLVRKTGSN
jgi:hypothetical protein